MGRTVGGALPDWRNPDDYAYTDGLRLHDWAWEFLRRDKNFREISLRYWDACERSEAEVSDFTDASLPFNLTEPAHPSVPAGNGVAPPWERYTGISLLDDYRQPDDEPGIPWSMLSLHFDLTMPLEPQFRQATRYLESFQKTWVDWVRTTEPDYEIGRKRRPQVEKFKGYIRALDGKAAGASQEQIGEVLFPDAPDPREVARYAIRAGEELAAGGYRDLLLMDNK